jgi:hypothetical protein
MPTPEPVFGLPGAGCLIDPLSPASEFTPIPKIREIALPPVFLPEFLEQAGHLLASQQSPSLVQHLPQAAEQASCVQHLPASVQEVELDWVCAPGDALQHVPVAQQHLQPAAQQLALLLTSTSRLQHSRQAPHFPASHSLPSVQTWAAGTISSLLFLSPAQALLTTTAATMP